jgi:hypothetical protein
MASQLPLVQGTLFEEGYLQRSLGPISSDPFVALTELVANAWDAGAGLVRIEIPLQLGQILSVEDDGSGMTRDQFIRRWMTLGYNRTKAQGKFAAFPPDRPGRRHAFGRSGVGRHGLLAFSDEYTVMTCDASEAWLFSIRALAGSDPFGLVREERLPPGPHGTALKVAISRNLPDPDQIRDILSARFLHDPSFSVQVNGQSVDLTELSGFIEQVNLEVEGLNLRATCIDSSRWVRRKAYHGVAFWVGGRLLGEPSWQIGEELVLDGRTRPARRFSIIIECPDAMFDYVLYDWSGFRVAPLVSKIDSKVASYATSFLRRVLADRIHETKVTLLRQHRDRLEELDPLGRIEVAEFLDQVTQVAPTISPDSLDVATSAVVNLAQSRSGAPLLAKLAKLDPDDIDALNTILDQWSVRDVLTVLREIDIRLAVIAALDKLINSPLSETADELHTLHPLVTKARWLFGPQFESEEYAFNITVRKALEKLLHGRIQDDKLYNPKHRPDLICLGDSSISAVATERFRHSGEVIELESILIVEVKRARMLLTRQEVTQAEGYVEDLAASELIDGRPRIDAYVVGGRVDVGLAATMPRTLGRPEFGKVDACTYDQLVRTAERRLFRLREKIQTRYDEVPALDLVNQVLSEPRQSSFDVGDT